MLGKVHIAYQTLEACHINVPVKRTVTLKMYFIMHVWSLEALQFAITQHNCALSRALIIFNKPVPKHLNYFITNWKRKSLSFCCPLHCFGEGAKVERTEILSSD